MSGNFSALRASIVALALILLPTLAAADEPKPAEGSADNTAKPVLTQSEIQELLDDIQPRDEKGSVLIVECGGAYGYATIQSAIDAANDGDIVVILPNTCNDEGRYYENINFLGKAITVQSAQPTNPDVVAATIIDGNANGSVVTIKTGEGPETVLNGVTITNGAGTYGGGIACEQSSPTIANCLISRNRALSGAGLFCDGSNPAITDCVFSENVADSVSPIPVGGGVYCRDESNPTLTGCIIRNNTSYDFGGGIYCRNSSNATLIECQILGNTAARGAGVNFYQCSPTLTNCRLSRNVAAEVGGAIYCASSDAVLINTIIDRNEAFDLLEDDSSAAGIYCYQSNPTLINCTIAANTATQRCGGLICSNSNPTLTNCILWGNSPQDIYTYESQPTLTYCDVGGGWEGTGNLDIDPGFAFNDDFHLMKGSPCIDAGAIPLTGELPSYDADGNDRILEGDGDQLASIDIGAYEFNPAEPAIAFSPPSLEFSVPLEEMVEFPQALKIRCTGDTASPWTLTWDVQWLQVTPAMGDSDGDVDEILMRVNGGILSPGIHRTAVTVANPSAVGNPRTIDVTVYVTRSLGVPHQYSTIQDAIDATSIRGDEVVLADGVYSGPGNKNLDMHGRQIRLRSMSGNPEKCVIDCEGDGRGLYFHTQETRDTIVEGLTIRNGFSSSGGGVAFYEGSNPTLKNCCFEKNTADYFGGGLVCSNSSPAFFDCVFADNTAGRHGGGLRSYTARPVLNNCTIRRNTASEQGGGVNASSSKIILTNCQIIENEAYAGGGLYDFGFDSPTLTNCVLRGNTANSGAAFYCSAHQTSLHNCTITENISSNKAGAFYCQTADPTLANCTLTANTAPIGGAFYCYLSDPILTNCILWGDGPEEFVLDQSEPALTYCNIQGGWEGLGNIDEDPLFAFPGDPHIMMTSPCVDAGTNSPPNDLTTFDIDGNLRLIDGDGDTQVSVDMGAYEINPGIPGIAVSSPKIRLLVAEGEASESPEILSIRNFEGGMLHWSVDWDASWLHVEPLQGESTGEANTILLTGHAETLPRGGYTTHLIVSDPQATNSPQLVEVTMCVSGEYHVPGEFATIQEAIDATTSPDDVVVLADGVYSGEGNKAIDFRGKALTLRSASGNSQSCVLDCGGNSRGIEFHSGETSDSVVEDITIINAFGSPGGAIVCENDSSPTLTRCVFTENNTTGVMVNASSPTLTECIMSLNSGPGISASYEASPTIIRCDVHENNAPGLYCYDASPVVRNCRIFANDYTGGVHCTNGAHPVISDCMIIGNRASSSGGGVYCTYDSHPTLFNCTISHNRSRYGGGVYCLYNSNPTLIGCILWDNAAYAVAVANSTPTLSYCDIKGGYAGTGNINADPLFVDPDGADDVPGTEDDDFRLLSNSPCIDAGDPDFIAEPEQTDLDGNPRVMGCGVDIGAYEFVAGIPGSGDLNGDGELGDADVALFVELLLTGGGLAEFCVADLNNDGQLDGRDINLYVQQVLMPQ